MWDCGTGLVRGKAKINENSSCVIAQEGAFSTHMKTDLEKWNGSRNNLKRPAVTRSYKKTMSWKRPSSQDSTGFGFVEISANHDGGLSLIAKELPETRRGNKEVMLDLTSENAVVLRDLLLFLHPL